MNSLLYNYKIQIIRMSRQFKEEKIIPLTFNGFNNHFILHIAKKAQYTLCNELRYDAKSLPYPFINKSEGGCYAKFTCKEMADKVVQFVDQVVTYDFPKDFKPRIILNIFNHSIDEKEAINFVYYVEENTLSLFHLEEGMAQRTIEKMLQLLERYMIPHPVVLVSELFASCEVKLSENELLMIPCGMKTFVMPIYSKEAQFMKAFSKTVQRITSNKVDCKGMDFYEVKDICKEIEIAGVYFFITPENVELSGLPFNVKNFSEILKRRLKEHQKEQSTEGRVLSRK
jgi:hypothetical protein